jgi:uncharacterized protein (TIGR02271 family)
MESLENLTQLRGKTVYGRDGEKVGKVEDFYVDEETGEPEWMGLGTGFFGTKHVIVPVAGYSIRDEDVYVPYEKDMIKDAPDIDSDEIDEERGGQLYEYYGLRRNYYQDEGQRGAQSGTGMTGQTGTSMSGQSQAPMTGQSENEMTGRSQAPMTSQESSQSVTRHEEDLHVGTRNVEAGRVRLRKWVETQPVSEDVQLRRETARIERQPLNEPATNADLGEREIELTLEREEPVVEKQVMAKERVTLNKDVEERIERVEAQLGRERVEVDGDDVDDTRDTAETVETTETTKTFQDDLRGRRP